MKIDVHCHFTPQEYFDELRKLDVPGVGKMVGVTIPVWESAESRLRAMDEVGIDVQALSLTAPGVFFEDKGLSIYMAQLTNDILGEICAKNPTRFLGFINMPLPHVDASVDELHRALSKPGMAGVCLGTNILGRALDTEELRPFFKEVDRLGLAVFVHPAAPRGMPNPEELSLGALVGFLFESMLTASRLALTGTIESLPGISWIFCHLGGAIPFMYGRLDSTFARHPGLRVHTSTVPGDNLRKLYYDTALSYKRASMACAYDFLGADHILLGTDYPLAWNELAATVEAIQALDFPSETKAKIFFENAKRILRIPNAMLEAYQR